MKTVYTAVLTVSFWLLVLVFALRSPYLIGLFLLGCAFLVAVRKTR